MYMQHRLTLSDIFPTPWTCQQLRATVKGSVARRGEGVRVVRRMVDRQSGLSEVTPLRLDGGVI